MFFKDSRHKFLHILFLFIFIFPAVSQENSNENIQFTVLPGNSHTISNTLSASRDTACMSYQVLPRVVSTFGSDFAFFGIRFNTVELRVGMFGMLELETLKEQPLNFLTVPSGPYLWRGLLGYSVLLSFHRLANKMFGENGGFEIGLLFRHESEHYTAPFDIEGSDIEDMPPNIGDFFIFDIGIRLPIRKLELDIRLQNKFFLPYSTYSFGPGFDIVLRYKVLKQMHLFTSVFGEYLFRKDRQEQENYLIRSIGGIVIPGKIAELQIFAAVSTGYGKGLLSYIKENSFGWGIRVSVLNINN